MDKIKEVVDALNEREPSWRENFGDMYLPSVYLYNGSDRDDDRRMMQSLLVEVLNKQKQLIDAHEAEGEKELWKKISDIVDSSSVIDIIKDINDSLVEMYYNTRPLREAKENIIPLIIDIFDHISASYTPDFFEMGEKYGIADTHEFITLVLQMDRIVSVHISRHYDKQTAQREFMKATGLESKYGLIYAELYEKHMERIQHNICIDKLEELSTKLDSLTEKIQDISQKLQQ